MFVCLSNVERPQMVHLLGRLGKDYLSSPYFSPSLHPFPKTWPPTLIYYGATESIASSITALGTRLTEAGVSVASYATSEEIPDRFSHDFLIMVNAENQWPAEVRKCWRRIKAWEDSLPTR